MENVLDKENLFAIVGASNNPEKYGNIVLNDLKNAGYNVIPINPHENEIIGLKAYHSLKEVPNQINIVVFVVPPKVVLSELEKVNKLGIKFVWMQPGSESDEAIKFCEENGIKCKHNACIMVKRPR